MNYLELQEVIAHILQEPCQSCSKNYNQEDVHILSTTQSEGVFFVTCGNCPSKLVVNVKFKTPTNKKSNSKRKHRGLNISRRKADKISSNDYLDMHNFLKEFRGDFKDFFHE